MNLQSITGELRRLEALIALASARARHVAGGVLSVLGAPPITSSGGANPTIGITPATPLASGSMSAADKAKLDALISLENNGVPLAGGPFETIDLAPGLTAANSGGGVARITPSGGVDADAVVFDPNPPGTPTTSVRTARSANQSPVTAGPVGATNLGSDTTGVTTGVSAAYATIGGGDQNVASGVSSCVPGGLANVASGAEAYAEGDHCTASGDQSHAEGQGTIASGRVSHAEGANSHAAAPASHCEGGNGQASGTNSHCEGNTCQAGGNDAHAEGTGTRANGTSSHSEGDSCQATGTASHAGGVQSSATRVGQEALAGGQIANLGDAQTSRCVLTSTGAAFTLAGGALVLESGKAYLVKAEGVVQSATDFSSFTMDVPCSFAGGAIVFPSGGVPTAVPATATTATAAAIAGNWKLTVSDGGGGSLVFTFSQTSAQNVFGVLALRFAEVAHP